MRHFPHPKLDLLKAFVVHTNQIERLHMSLQIVEQTIKDGKENGDPLAAGQFSAINYILQEVSPNDNLIPKNTRSEIDSHESLKWMRNIHVKLMTPIIDKAEKHLEPTLPRHTLGSYRTSPKKLGKRQMPHPASIRSHLHSVLQDLIAFNQLISPKLQNPRSLSRMDVQLIADKAYQTHLHICCIKPFEDGSNRTARLVENALRLYWGLHWKNIPYTEKDKLLNDIFQLQDKNYYTKT